MSKKQLPVASAIEPFSWLTGERIYGISCYVLMVAFAYLTPSNVLDQYPQAKELTDFMASWNLQIRRIGEISGPANQANRFVYSVLWCAMPLWWVPLIYGAYRKYQPSSGKRGTLEIPSWGGFFIDQILAVLMIYILFFLPYAANASKLGLLMFYVNWSRAIFAPGIVFLSGVVVFFLLVLVPILLIKKRVVIKGK